MKNLNECEIELDNSTLMTMLDELAPYIPEGTTNEKLKEFIRNAFHVTNDSAEGASDLTHLIFKPDARYLDLLPALRAGDITFDSLCDILTTEIGIWDESNHGV